MKTLIPSIAVLTILSSHSFKAQAQQDTETASNLLSKNETAYVSDSSSYHVTYSASSYHDHGGANSAKSSHMMSERHIPSTLSPGQLAVGKTYNRYGDIASPRGYGIQVITFKKTRNLCKYLHLYHNKEMFIQVISFDNPKKEKMYRVILGADENKTSIEREIRMFQKAGLQAVLRKHK
jgi:hypothetical protein